MGFPIQTLDLPCELLLPVGGSFQHRPYGEFGQGQWLPYPRATGIRQKLWAPVVELAAFTKGERGDRRFEFEAFIDRLSGTTVAFRLFDPWRILPRGVGAGIWNPRQPRGRLSTGSYGIDGAYLVDGTYQIDGGSTIAYVEEDTARYADSLRISGLVPDALVFKVGDDFEVGGNLYRVMEDAQSDSAGHSRVSLSWRLWKPALAGDQVNLHRPSGRFILTDVDQGVIQRSYAGGQASIQAIEVPVTE
jgi:hypothetical protein